MVCTPSYALLLADVIEEKGINLASMSLKYGLFGGEPWSEAMRNEIQNKLNIIATDNYGLSEVMGPGVAGECKESNGLHINEDHFLVEVVESIFFDQMNKQRELIELIKKRLNTELGIGVDIKLMSRRKAWSARKARPRG